MRKQTTYTVQGAENAGRDAHKAGILFAENPYPFDSTDYWAWNHGWKIIANKATCRHDEWSPWREIGRTGDWFKPIIARRECLECGATQTEDQ